MNDPCSILCESYVINDGFPAVCVDPAAVLDNGTRVAKQPNCKHFQLRYGHSKMIACLGKRIDTIKADLVEETNRMWWRRFSTAGCVVAMVAALIFAFVHIWVVT